MAGSEEALKLKNTKVLNMIILGALIKVRKTVDPQTIKDVLYKVLPERHHKLIPLNLQAFDVGMSLIK